MGFTCDICGSTFPTPLLLRLHKHQDECAAPAPAAHDDGGQGVGEDRSEEAETAAPQPVGQSGPHVSDRDRGTAELCASLLAARKSTLKEVPYRDPRTQQMQTWQVHDPSDHAYAALLSALPGAVRSEPGELSDEVIGAVLDDYAIFYLQAVDAPRPLRDALRSMATAAGVSERLYTTMGQRGLSPQERKTILSEVGALEETTSNHRIVEALKGPLRTQKLRPAAVASAVRAHLLPECGAWVVDLGCGSGQFAVEFGRLGCTVVGVDTREDAMRDTAAKADAAGLPAGRVRTARVQRADASALATALAGAGVGVAGSPARLDLWFLCDTTQYIDGSCRVSGGLVGYMRQLREADVRLRPAPAAGGFPRLPRLCLVEHPRVVNKFRRQYEEAGWVPCSVPALEASLSYLKESNRCLLLFE